MEGTTAMIASMFNLDHRLAELRETADDIRRGHLARDARQTTGSPIASLRSLLGRRPVAGRSAGLAL
jgi:hypothetical protein